MERHVLFKSVTGDYIRIEKIEGLDLSRIREKADEERHQAEKYMVLSERQVQQLREEL